MKITDLKFENYFQHAALAAAGITTLEQCAQKGTVEVLNTKGVGKKTLRALREACYLHSIQWKMEKSEVERIEAMKAYFEKHGVEADLAKKIATAGFHEGRW